MEKTPAEITRIDMETAIAASPAKVWTALTEGIGQWWPNEFYSGGEDGARRFLLEARVGGRMYEEWDNGGGVLWATVVALNPNQLLQIFGTSFPSWGGPSVLYGTWELKPSDGGTLLSFSESTVGRIADSGVAEKDKGWKFLWAALQAHVEGTSAPVWVD